MSPLVIATHNEGKAREFALLLAGTGIEVISAKSLNLPEPEETGATFRENAALKAQSAATLSGHYALADDSGLCIEALGGDPGVYSARWAGHGKDFGMAFERIRNALLEKNIPPEGAKACFICVLALTSPEGKTQFFEGRVDGVLTFPPRGTSGFGYDPIFVPHGEKRAFAEMGAHEKQSISHRARAFEAFVQSLARREAS